jgi:ketol-acid reductoisomerase
MPEVSAIEVFGERDANLGSLGGKVVAAIGYGHLGRSMALNLRDSGLDVIVGNRDDEYVRQAVRDGFNRLEIADAVEQADVVYFLLPDEVVEDVFDDIRGFLKPGTMIVFPSGYNLAFGLIDPPRDVDVCLLAPRMVGVEIRELYEARQGFFTFVNVEQDASGAAWPRLLALARASGSLRRGALRLSARDEATLDLFIEQGVGPYIGTAIQLAFQLGVEAGLPPEAIVLEMYMSGEMAQTMDSWARNGFYRSVGDHGPTAQFGGFIRATNLDRQEMEQRMRSILEQIRDGSFAREFQAEKADGYPRLGVVQQVIAGSDPQTDAEESLRQMLRRAGGE